MHKSFSSAGLVKNPSDAGVLYGFSVTAYTSGGLDIYDGQSDSGTTLVYSKATIARGDVVHFGGNGIWCPNGIYVKPGTATVDVHYE